MDLEPPKMVEQPGYDFGSALTRAGQAYLEQLFAARPELQAKMAVDFTPAFREELKLAADEEYNVDLRFLGDKGNGKSSAALTAKFWFDLYANNDFNVETVCFTIQDAIKYMKDNPDIRDVAIIIDEQIDQVGDASVTRKKRFSRLQQTTRKHSISFFYCSPRNVFYRDRLFQRYNVWSLRLFDVASKTQMCFCTDSQNVYGLGSLYFPLVPKEIWDVYNAKKDDFIVKAKSQDVTSMDYADDAIKILNADQKIKTVFEEEAAFLAEKRSYDQMDRDEKKSSNKPYPPAERFNSKYLDMTIRMAKPDLIGSERDMVSKLLLKSLQGEDIRPKDQDAIWHTSIDISKYRKKFMESAML
jgi:hypothetical protein